jgi:hypothetical protein
MRLYKYELKYHLLYYNFRGVSLCETAMNHPARYCLI